MMANQKQFKAQVRQQLRQKQHLNQTRGDHVGAKLLAVAAIRKEILPRHLVVQLDPRVHLVVEISRSQDKVKQLKFAKAAGRLRRTLLCYRDVC